MSLSEVLTIIAMACGIVGAYFKANSDMDNKIDTAVTQGDEKRAKIYARLDEVKTELRKELKEVDDKMMQDFTQIKVCQIIHKNSDNNFNRLEGKVDTIGEKLDKLIEKK